MNAKDFVYQHFGKAFLEKAPTTELMQSRWQRRPGYCFVCGDFSEAAYHENSDDHAICPKCFLAWFQSPALGTLEKKNRAGCLREGWVSSLTVVTEEGARLYLSDKSQKPGMSVDGRKEQVARYFSAEPGLGEIMEYRPLSRRWLDLAETKPPYVAFQSQGSGNNYALAKQLDEGLINQFVGLATWLNGDGVWMRIPAEMLLDMAALAAEMAGESSAWKNNLGTEWKIIANGKDPMDPAFMPDHIRKMVQKQEKARAGGKKPVSIRLVVDDAREKYPQMERILRRSPMQMKMVNALVKMLTQPVEEVV